MRERPLDRVGVPHPRLVEARGGVSPEPVRRHLIISVTSNAEWT